jgi:predicted RNase H-like nuclease (RuvC/YqgF family)
LIAFIKKWFWILLIAVAFGLGMLMSKGPDKELREKYEKEREEIGKRLEEKEKQIEQLGKEGEELRVRMREDSVKYAAALRTRDRNITTLENTIKKVDYRNARATDLDSLRRILLRSR